MTHWGDGQVRRKSLNSIRSWNSNLHLLKAYLVPGTLPTLSDSISEQICQRDVVLLISQMTKVRLREVNFFVQSHTAGR